MKAKKALSFILTLAMIFTMAAGFTTVGFVETAEDVHATEIDSGDCGPEGDVTSVHWSLDDSGVLTITGAGELNSTYDLSDCAATATAIVIDEDIKTISAGAFVSFSNLTTVTAPGVETIGSLAFAGCSSLTEINLPAVKTLSTSAFSSCSNLTTVNMPELTEIGGSVFYNTSLVTIDLPAVTTIGESAFNGCMNLTTVTMPALTTIGSLAFKLCTSLSTVSMPEATTVLYYVFEECSGLETINLPKVTTIGDYAFKDCTSLTTISLPAVTTINQAAFSGCSALTSIDIPEVTSVMGNAFKNCSSLETVNFKKVVTIDSNAFNGCSKLTEVSFNAVPASVAGNAFDGVSGSGIVKVPAESIATFEAITLTMGGITVSTDSAAAWHYVTVAAVVPPTPRHGGGGGRKVVTTQSAVEITTAAVTTPAVEVPVETPVVSYVDVKSGVWYESAANFCANKGIIGGISEGVFGGSQNTQRGQIVTMLMRVENLTGKAEAKYTAGLFADVNANAYYADSIAWAAKNNIVKGMGTDASGNANFGATQAVTREQLATILYNYATYRNLNTSLAADANVAKYKDAEKVSAYAKNAMLWATENGIITGINTEDGIILNPQGTATRAEIAVMIMRLCTGFNNLI